MDVDAVREILFGVAVGVAVILGAEWGMRKYALYLLRVSDDDAEIAEQTWKHCPKLHVDECDVIWRRDVPDVLARVGLDYFMELRQHEQPCPCDGCSVPYGEEWATLRDDRD